MGIESQPNARGAEQCTSTAWSCRPWEHGWGWHMCQWASLFKMPFLCALLTYGHGNWNEGMSVMDRSIRLQHAMELEAPWRTCFSSGVTKKTPPISCYDGQGAKEAYNSWTNSSSGNDYTLSESVNKIHMLQSCESEHDNEAAAAAAAEESLRSCTSSVDNRGPRGRLCRD